MRLIDADALCDDVMERYCKDCEKRKGIKRGKWRVIYEIGEAPCRACDVDDLKMELDEAPTIDAELVKHGKWLMSDVYGAYCSECGSAAFEITGSRYSKMKTRYCWHCGARMDEE